MSDSASDHDSRGSGEEGISSRRDNGKSRKSRAKEIPSIDGTADEDVGALLRVPHDRHRSSFGRLKVISISI